MDTKVLPVAGTYKIKLDPIGANTGSATLKLYTVPADISTTIIKNGATVTPTTTVPGQNATVTFTGVATDPPYTLSLGPAIAVPVQITITGPTGLVSGHVRQPDPELVLPDGRIDRTVPDPDERDLHDQDRLPR